MTNEEARDLIDGGVVGGGTWADLGAGTGTFTRALADLLEPGSTVWAVDRSDHAVRALESLNVRGEAELHVVRADFTGPLELPELDGLLMANSLHFVEEPEGLLRRLVLHLRPGGLVLLVEYDQSRGNPWVPHPIPARRFPEVARAVGLVEPREVGRRASSFGREMYAAVARRPAKSHGPATTLGDAAVAGAGGAEPPAGTASRWTPSGGRLDAQ